MRDTEKFWDEVQFLFFGDECGELDYDTFLEIGQACSLIESSPYDPEGAHKDTPIAFGEPEPGDPVYSAVPKEQAHG